MYMRGLIILPGGSGAVGLHKEYTGSGGRKQWLFVIAKGCRHPGCSFSKETGREKINNIHMIKYYATVKRNEERGQKRNEM